MNGPKSFDIVALGELLIDFSDAGFSAAGQRLYEQNPGGAPANVLCMASRLGGRTAFIGKVGDDIHGRFLRDVLHREGIDTRGLIMDATAATTLAFVNISPDGEREFAFCRKPGADTLLREDELDRELLESCRIFHFGSLSLTDEPARSATMAAVKAAKAKGALISYDPNYRPPLWRDETVAKELMRLPVPLADYLKVSEEEAFLLTDCDDVSSAASALLDMGAGCVVVTIGAKGAFYTEGSERGHVPAFKAGEAVDSTGAGDAFWGAFLSRLAAGEDAEGLERWVKYANAAAALCVTRRGAIPAMPRKEEVEGLLG